MSDTTSAVAASPAAAKQLANLARMYRLWGRYSEAEDLLKRAITMERELHPKEGDARPVLLKYIENLAGLFSQQGRVRESEIWTKRVLEGRAAMKTSIVAAVATAVDKEKELLSDVKRHPTINSGKKLTMKVHGKKKAKVSTRKAVGKRKVILSKSLKTPIKTKKVIVVEKGMNSTLSTSFNLNGRAANMAKRQVKPLVRVDEKKVGTKQIDKTSIYIPTNISVVSKDKASICIPTNISVVSKVVTPAGAGAHAARAQAQVKKHSKTFNDEKNKEINMKSSVHSKKKELNTKKKNLNNKKKDLNNKKNEPENQKKELNNKKKDLKTKKNEPENQKKELNNKKIKSSKDKGAKTKSSSAIDPKVQAARNAAIKRVRNLKRLESQMKKKVNFVSLQNEEREKQLKKFRDEAAARVRGREMKANAQRMQKIEENRERKERLDNLQQWLQQKKLMKEFEKQKRKNQVDDTLKMLKENDEEQKTIAVKAQAQAHARLKLEKKRIHARKKKIVQEIKIHKNMYLERQQELQQVRRKRVRAEKEKEIKDAAAERRAKAITKAKRENQAKRNSRVSLANQKYDKRPQSAQPRMRPVVPKKGSLNTTIEAADLTVDSRIKKTSKIRPSTAAKSRPLPHDPARKLIKNELSTNSTTVANNRNNITKTNYPKTDELVHRGKRPQTSGGMKGKGHFNLAKARKTRNSQNFKGNRQVWSSKSKQKLEFRGHIRSGNRPATAISRRKSSSSNTASFRRFTKLPEGGKSAQDVNMAELRFAVSNSNYEGKSSLSFYKLGRLLGEGNFGKVLLAQHKLSGRRVAVKYYEKHRFISDRDMMRQLRREMRIMAGCNHLNICKLFEAFETSRRAYLVMEFCEGGNLIEHMRKRYPGSAMPEGRAQRLFSPLFDALKHLHNLNIVHRDIKLDNVLLDSSQECLKLTDFGFSIRLTDREKHRLKLFCGTPAYMAPEIVRGHSYRGLPVDIWALGVVLFAAVAGRFPFMANYEKALFKKITLGNFQAPKGISRSLETLLRGVINVGTRERYTVEHVMQHPWVVTGIAASKDYQKLHGQPTIAPFYVSSDSSHDFRDDALRTVESFGFTREKLEKALVEKKRNQFTTSYYLVLGKIRHLPLQLKLLESANTACEAMRRAKEAEHERKEANKVKVGNVRSSSTKDFQSRNTRNNRQIRNVPRRPGSAVAVSRLHVPAPTTFGHRRTSVSKSNSKPYSPVKHQKKRTNNTTKALTGYYRGLSK